MKYIFTILLSFLLVTGFAQINRTLEEHDFMLSNNSEGVKKSYMEIRIVRGMPLVQFELTRNVVLSDEGYRGVAIEIYNLIGDRVKSIDFDQRDPSVMLNIAGWEKGYYISKLLVDGKVMEGKKFVVGR